MPPKPGFRMMANGLLLPLMPLDMRTYMWGRFLSILVTSHWPIEALFESHGKVDIHRGGALMTLSTLLAPKVTWFRSSGAARQRLSRPTRYFTWLRLQLA